MAQINLFIVVDTKKPVLSDTDSTDFIFPDLCQGDSTTLAITLLKRLTQFTFQKLSASAYSVRMGLFKSDGTVLSYVAAGSFAADLQAQTFTAVFPLNTANVDTAIGANTSYQNAVLQVEITEIATGAVTTVYTNTRVTVLKDYLSNATQAVAASEAGASQGWVSAGFVPKYPNAASVRFEQSPDGTFWRVWRDNDGIEKSEHYTPPP